MSSESLRVAIFACGRVDGKLETVHGLTNGVQGVGELFNKFLIDKPAGVAKTSDPTFEDIARKLQPVVYDVFGRDGLPVEDVKTDIFGYDDTLYPSKDQLRSTDAIFVSGSVASMLYLQRPQDKGRWEGNIKRLQRYLRGIIDSVEYSRIKIIGICFGHQIISFAGGKGVGRNPQGWELGPTKIELEDIGKGVFPNTEDGTLTIYELHEDHVLRNEEPGGMGDSGHGRYGGVPAGVKPRPVEEMVIDKDVTPIPELKCWATNQHTPNQGMIKIPQSAVKKLRSKESYLQALEEIHIFTLQGHPEFEAGMLASMIEELCEGNYFKQDRDKQTAAVALEELKKNHATSSDEIAVVIWQMLKGAYNERIAAQNRE